MRYYIATLVIALFSLLSSVVAVAQDASSNNLYHVGTWGADEFFDPQSPSYHGGTALSGILTAIEQEDREYEARCPMYRNIQEELRAAKAHLSAIRTKLQAMKLQRAAASDAKLLKKAGVAEQKANRATKWAVKRANIARLIRVKIANVTRAKAEAAEQSSIRAVIRAKKRLGTASEATDKAANTPYYAIARTKVIEAQAALDIAEATAAVRQQAAAEAAALAKLLGQPIQEDNETLDEEAMQTAIIVAKQRYQEAHRIARPYLREFCTENFEYGCYPLIPGDPVPGDCWE